MSPSRRSRVSAKSSKSASAFDSNDWWSEEKSSKGSKGKAKSYSGRQKHRTRHEDEQDDGDGSKVSSTKFLPHERLDWGDRRIRGSVHTKKPRRHAHMDYDRLNRSETTSGAAKQKDRPRKARTARRPSRPCRSKSESNESISEPPKSVSSLQSPHKRKRHKSRSKPRSSPYATVIEENIEYVRADILSSSSASAYRPRRIKSYYHSASAVEARKLEQKQRHRSKLLKQRHTEHYIPRRPVYVYRRDTPDREATEVWTSSKPSARIVSGPRGHLRFVRPARGAHCIRKPYEPRRRASDYIILDSRKARPNSDRPDSNRRKAPIDEDDSSFVGTVPDRGHARRSHGMQPRESSDTSAPTSRKSSLSAARTASLFAAMRRQRAR